MSHHHGLDEYDDATLLRELLLRAELRAKPTESTTPAESLGQAPVYVHLMTPSGGIECGEDRPSRGTPDPTSATCPKCLHTSKHKNGAAS